MNPKEIKDLTDRLPRVTGLHRSQSIAERAEIGFHDPIFHDHEVKRQLVYVAGISHNDPLKPLLVFSREAREIGHLPWIYATGFKTLDELISYRRLD